MKQLKYVQLKTENFVILQRIMILFKNKRTNSETGFSITSWLYLSFCFEYVIGFVIISFSVILNIIKLLLPKPPRNLTGNVVLVCIANINFNMYTIYYICIKI